MCEFNIQRHENEHGESHQCTTAFSYFQGDFISSVRSLGVPKLIMSSDISRTGYMGLMEHIELIAQM